MSILWMTMLLPVQKVGAPPGRHHKTTPLPLPRRFPLGYGAFKLLLEFYLLVQMRNI